VKVGTHSWSAKRRINRKGVARVLHHPDQPLVLGVGSVPPRCAAHVHVLVSSKTSPSLHSLHSTLRDSISNRRDWEVERHLVHCLGVH
jgi:hypothetical protein